MDLCHALNNLSLTELPLLDVPHDRKVSKEAAAWVVSPSLDFHIRPAGSPIAEDAVGLVPREVYSYPAPDEAEQCQCYNCMEQYGYRTYNSYKSGPIDRVHTWGADAPFRRCTHLPGPACAHHVAADDAANPSPVPPLAMVYVTVGTRDEISAHLAVAKALAAVGHTIRFATYKAHAEFLHAERRACEPALAARLSFFALSDPLELANGRIASHTLLTLHPPSLHNGAAAVRALLEDVCDACRVDGGAFDVILAAPPLTAIATHVAELYPATVVIAMATFPVAPTRVIPNPLLGVGGRGWPAVGAAVTAAEVAAAALRSGGYSLKDDLKRRSGRSRSRSKSRSRSRRRRRDRSNDRDATSGGGATGRSTGGYSGRSRSRSHSRSRSRSRSARSSRAPGTSYATAVPRGGPVEASLVTTDVRQSYALGDNLQWLATAHITEELRRNVLHLPPSGECDGARLRRLRVPTVYLTSSHLFPPPTDGGDHVTSAGISYLPAVSPRHLDPPADLPSELAELLATRSSIGYIELPNAFTNAQFVDPTVVFRSVIGACCAYAPRHVPFGVPATALAHHRRARSRSSSRSASDDAFTSLGERLAGHGSSPSRRSRRASRDASRRSSAVEEIMRHDATGGVLDAVIFDLSFAPDVATTLPIVLQRDDGRGDKLRIAAVGDSGGRSSDCISMVATAADGRAVNVVILRRRVPRPWLLQHRNVRLIVHGGEYGPAMDAVMTSTAAVAVCQHRYHDWLADVVRAPRLALREASAATLARMIGVALAPEHAKAYRRLSRKVVRQTAGTLRRVVAAIHRSLPMTTSGEWLCSVFEYQCLRPASQQWVPASAARLLTWADITCSVPTERSAFKDGGIPGHAWRWAGDWEVANDDNTDEVGWTYATGSTAQHFYQSATACPGTSSIRRRRWVRAKVAQLAFVGVDTTSSILNGDISGTSVQRVGRPPPDYLKRGVTWGGRLAPDDVRNMPHVSVTLSGIPLAQANQRGGHAFDAVVQTPAQRPRDGGTSRSFEDDMFDGDMGIGPARLVEKGVSTGDDGANIRGLRDSIMGRSVGFGDPAHTPRHMQPPSTVALSVTASRSAVSNTISGFPSPSPATDMALSPHRPGPAPVTVSLPATRSFRYAPYASAAAQAAAGTARPTGTGHMTSTRDAMTAFRTKLVATAPPGLRQGSWYWKLDPYRGEAVKRFAFVVEDGAAIGTGYEGPSLAWTAEEIPILRDPNTGAVRVEAGVLRGCLPLNMLVTCHMEVIDPRVSHPKWPNHLVRVC